jgi:hypothetical protein
MDVEVENLLDVAVEGAPSDAPLLKHLKDSCGWPDVDLSPEDGSPRKVPLGRWADVVVAYLEGGVARMVDLAMEGEDELASFPLAVLEAIGSVESIRGTVTIGRYAWGCRPPRKKLACLCAKTLNLQVGVPNALEVPEDSAKEIRDFLHAMIESQLEHQCLVSVCYALRGVGDEKSIKLVSRLPAFRGAYEGLEKNVVKAIRKRLG